MEQESSMSKWGKQEDKGNRKLAVAIILSLIFICGVFYAALGRNVVHPGNPAKIGNQ